MFFDLRRSMFEPYMGSRKASEETKIFSGALSITLSGLHDIMNAMRDAVNSIDMLLLRRYYDKNPSEKKKLELESPAMFNRIYREGTLENVKDKLHELSELIESGRIECGIEHIEDMELISGKAYEEIKKTMHHIYNLKDLIDNVLYNHRFNDEDLKAVRNYIDDITYNYIPKIIEILGKTLTAIYLDPPQNRNTDNMGLLDIIFIGIFIIIIITTLR